MLSDGEYRSDDEALLFGDDDMIAATFHGVAVRDREEVIRLDVNNTVYWSTRHLGPLQSPRVYNQQRAIKCEMV